MKINQIRAGIFLSYGQMLLQVLMGLLYTPVMIRLLGQADYGLYNTVASTISMLNILNLGFGSSYIRYFSKYNSIGDKKSIEKVNALFLLVFCIIGIIAVLCGAFLTTNLNAVFSNGLTIEEYKKAKTLMVLFTIIISLSFPMTVFTSYLCAHERFVFIKLVTTIQYIITPCITIPFLYLGYGSIGLVTISLSLSAVVWLLNVWYSIRKLGFRICFKGIDFRVLRSIFGFSSFIALNMIVDQINWNIDKVLIARFIGTSAVAIYAVGASLYSYYQNFSTSISDVFTPRIHRITYDTANDMESQKRQLTELFTKVGRMQFVVLMLIATGMLFFGEFFITNIWVGEEYKESYYVALLLMWPASIALIQNVGIEIQRAKNCHKFRSVVYVIMAGANLIISVILCQHYGTIGCAMGTAISLIIANGLIMNIYYQKRCNIDIVFFWKSILKLSAPLSIPVVVGILLNKYIHNSSVWLYLFKICIYSLVYVATVWLLGLNEYEKELVRESALRLCHLQNNTKRE